jgi:hypothetical protein
LNRPTIESGRSSAGNSARPPSSTRSKDVSSFVAASPIHSQGRSTSRPFIEADADDSGVSPQHINEIPLFLVVA